ncbi:unnamed protein product [Dicrocoelium dendriticum]|nr:unnamed protein product [Dicrocoelium dendriticum]
MPFHEYSTFYPTVPNNNASYRQIWFDNEMNRNESYIQWRLQFTAKVTYFKIHDLKSGSVYFECEALRVGGQSCCIQNTLLSEIKQTRDCPHRLYNSEFGSRDYTVSFESRKGPPPNWNHSMATIFVFTPEGSRRYFFGWPGKLGQLVCPEIARSGHSTTVETLTELISQPELHSIDYESFMNSMVYLRPNTPLRLHIRSFTLPGQANYLIAFDYEEKSRSFNISFAPLVRSVSVLPTMGHFTERVQLVDQYESHMQQHEFVLTPRYTCRALVFAVGSLTEEKFRLLYHLLYQWIVLKNDSAIFDWVSPDSPGIRIVQVNAFPYTGVGSSGVVEFQVKIDGQQSVQCSRTESDGNKLDVSHRFKYLSKVHRLRFAGVTKEDSGQYTCTVRQTNRVLFRDHWIIALPSTSDAHLLFLSSPLEVDSADFTKWPETGVNDKVIFTATSPTVACWFNLSALYEHYDGMKLVAEHTECDCQDVVNKVTEKQIDQGATRLFITVYNIKPCVSNTEIGEYRFTCSYEYTTKVGKLRRDTFVDQTECLIRIHRNAFYVKDHKPYVIARSIKSSIPELTEALQAKHSASGDVRELLLNYVQPPFADINWVVAFDAVHLDPGGWASVWIFAGDRPYKCLMQQRRLTAEHSVNVVFRRSDTNPVRNSLWNYQCTCLLRPHTSTIVLLTFNTMNAVVNKDELTFTYLNMVKDRMANFDPRTDTLILDTKVLEENDVFITHRIINMRFPVPTERNLSNQLPVFIDHLFNAGMDNLLDRYIHRGESVWRAVDFHNSGSVKRLPEQVSYLSVVLYLGEPVALLSAWTINLDEITSEVSRKPCHMLMSNKLEGIAIYNIPNMPLGVTELNHNKFECVIRADVVAILLLALQVESSQAANIEKQILEETRESVQFWVRHPHSGYPRPVFNTARNRAAFRIQRANIGYVASLYPGERWDSGIRWNRTMSVSCYRSKVNGERILVSHRSVRPPHAWFITKVTVKDMGRYECYVQDCAPKCRDILIEPSRQLTVLPNKDSLFVYYTHYIPSNEELQLGTVRTAKPELHMGETSYISCVVRYFPEWSELVELRLRLTAEPMDVTGESEVIPTQRLDSSSSFESIFDITQWHQPWRYDRMRAECILQIRAENLQWTDLRQGQPQPLIIKAVALQLKGARLVNIFNQYIYTDDPQLQDVMVRTPANIVSMEEYQLSPVFLFASESEYTIWTLVALGSRQGIVTMHLHSRDNNTAVVHDEPCRSGNARQLTEGEIPNFIRSVYRDERRLYQAKLVNASFICKMTSKHIALSIIVHESARTAESVQELVRQRIQQWWNGMVIPSSLPTHAIVSVQSVSTDGTIMKIEKSPDPLNTATLIVKVLHAAHASEISAVKAVQELAPIMFDEDMFIYPSIEDYEEINCG